jgi:hypothetical protein
MSAASYFTRFENELLKAKGEAFQTLFENLMGRAHPGDFEPARPAGRDGDWKCDGFLASERRLFQVYGPERIFSAEVCRKIRGDLAGALQHWGGRMQKWTFVHNDAKALPAQAIRLIQDLRSANPAVTIEVWGRHELTTRFQTLKEPDLLSWFGPLDVSPQIAEVLTINRATFDAVQHLVAMFGTRGPEAVPPTVAASSPEQRMAYYLACCVYAFRSYEELGIDNFMHADDKAPDIWDIFVPPACAEQPISPEEMEAAQSADPPENPARDLLPLLANEYVRRHVLLGDPGMGKSTLIQRLIAGLADGRPTPGAESLRDSIPIPFVLRDIVPLLPSDVSEWNWDTLCRTLHQNYRRNHQAQPLCIAWTSYRDFNTELLSHPRAFFLLDGLDEIGDLVKRTRIRDAIWEGFRAHSEARWLITSRVIGYESANADKVECLRDDSLAPSFGERWLPLSVGFRYNGNPREHELFAICLAQTLYLSPFEDCRQNEFTRNWFRERNPSAPSTDLLQEIRQRGQDGIRAIARVPNLLCYMAILKRSGKPLPDGRALLYTEIVRAYLDGIDRAYHLSAKDHGHACPFSVKDTRHLLAMLAAEMQRQRAGEPRRSPELPADPTASESHTGATARTNGAFSDGNITISETEVRALLIPVIQRLQPSTDAPLLLREFLGHIAHRSGLLLPRGTNEQGTLYGFTHLSFLEYFAACYVNDQLTEADSRLVAATRRNFDVDKWDREHPPGPILVTSETLELWASDPPWTETLCFLAELRAENPDALDLLLQDLFPALHGSRKDEPFPVIKDRELYPPWGPIRETAVELAIRILRDQHLDLSSNTAVFWYTRLWVAYLSLDFPPHYQPWLIASKLLGESIHANLAQRAFETALSEHPRLEYLSLPDCKGLTKLTRLPDSVKLIWLAGCTGLTHLDTLPSNLKTLVLDFCTSLTHLDNLPDGLESLQLIRCTGLAQLDRLPDSLLNLNIIGCTGLNPETLQRLERWAEMKSPPCKLSGPI